MTTCTFKLDMGNQENLFYPKEKKNRCLVTKYLSSVHRKTELYRYHCMHKKLRWHLRVYMKVESFLWQPMRMLIVDVHMLTLVRVKMWSNTVLISILNFTSSYCRIFSDEQIEVKKSLEIKPRLTFASFILCDWLHKIPNSNSIFYM